MIVKRILDEYPSGYLLVDFELDDPSVRLLRLPFLLGRIKFDDVHSPPPAKT